MTSKKTRKSKRRRAPLFYVWRLFKWTGLLLVGAVLFVLVWVASYAVVSPLSGAYMLSESARLGGIERRWVPIEAFSPVMARSVVAAEDANFCLHHGIDFEALQEAIEGGGARGASTLTQQVAKNVFLWHGRSYFRKALEAGFALLIELMWSKERIIEVYLNVAELDEGVFGFAAGGKHYFGVAPRNITALQAARMAAILPSPKNRSASRPTSFVRKRTRAILSGAQTILADGRADCFTQELK